LSFYYVQRGHARRSTYNNVMRKHLQKVVECVFCTQKTEERACERRSGAWLVICCSFPKRSREPWMASGQPL